MLNNIVMVVAGVFLLLPGTLATVIGLGGDAFNLGKIVGIIAIILAVWAFMGKNE